MIHVTYICYMLHTYATCYVHMLHVTYIRYMLHTYATCYIPVDVILVIINHGAV